MQSAAKWVTDEQRRFRIDEKVTIRLENNEREQAKKESQTEASKEKEE